MNFKIKEARILLGISQKELAEKLGVASGTLSGYESGLHDPKSDILCKIADICNVSVDFLLCRDEKTQVHPLVKIYNDLNVEGQEKLMDYATDLSSMEKYKKCNSISKAI